MKGRYEDQLRARKLRSQGYTIKEICTAVKAAKGSVSVWVKDVQVLPEHLARLEQTQKKYKNHKAASVGRNVWSAQCAKIRETFREQGRVQASLNSADHAMGCALYWAEGSKDRNQFCFANSDAGMMRRMVAFLQKYFNVTGDDLKVRVSFYENGILDTQKVEEHWGKVIGLENIEWQKHLINPYNKNKVDPANRVNHVNKLPFGVCHLKVAKSTRIVHHIYGAIEVYSEGQTIIDPQRTNTNHSSAPHSKT